MSTMKQWLAISTLLLVSSACDDAAREAPGSTKLDVTTPHDHGDTILILGSDYSTASVLAVTTSKDFGKVKPNEIGSFSSDAVLRKFGTSAVVLDRGGDNIAFLSVSEADDVQVAKQVALGANCNPQDIELLDENRALVSCWNRAATLVVDFQHETSSDGVNLGALDTQDNSPNMEQMVRIGDKIYIAIQRLDGYTVTQDGILAVIDAVTLNYERSIALPCANPAGGLEADSAGFLLVNCYGSSDLNKAAMLIRVDPSDDSHEVLIEQSGLDGIGMAYAHGRDDNHYFLVSKDYAEMRLTRVAPDTEGNLAAIMLAQDPGFSYSGLALDSKGTAYFGSRVANETSGIWAIDADKTAHGPVTLSMMPADVLVF